MLDSSREPPVDPNCFSDRRCRTVLPTAHDFVKDDGVAIGHGVEVEHIAEQDQS
jgi:hypothetical protein